MSAPLSRTRPVDEDARARSHSWGTANGTLVQQIFATAPFLETVGIELVDAGSGTCDTRLTVAPHLYQQHGFVHAGALMTLADHMCGGAAASTVGDDQDVLTIETRVACLRPAVVSRQVP